jgi:hypothetical protein
MACSREIFTFTVHTIMNFINPYSQYFLIQEIPPLETVFFNWCVSDPYRLQKVKNPVPGCALFSNFMQYQSSSNP